MDTEMTTSFSITSTYKTSTGIVGAVYEVDGRRCSSFVGKSPEALASWIVKGRLYTTAAGRLSLRLSFSDSRVAIAERLIERLSEDVDGDEKVSMWARGESVHVYVNNARKRYGQKGFERGKVALWRSPSGRIIAYTTGKDRTYREWIDDCCASLGLEVR